MNYRRTTILAEKSYTADATETFDLRISKPISRIDIAYRVTKGNNYMSAQPAADITKVELVDGSDVLFALTGWEMQALNIYDRKVPTMNYGQHISGSYEYSTYGLDFGRYLWDKELALDPNRFDNLQLKITFTIATCDTGGTPVYIEITGFVFDEKEITPIGFLSPKELYSYTPSANDTYRYIELPTARVLRQLLIRGAEMGYDPHETVVEAKIDEDNDARVVFDMDLEDYNRMNKGVFPMVQEQMVGYIHTGADHIFYVTPTDMCLIAAGTPQTGDAAVYSNSYPRGGKIDLRCTNSTMFSGMAMGWLPNHCISLPFGNQGDVDDWYDVTKVGDLRLRLKSGSRGTSGTIQVVTQQLRKY